MLDHLITPEQTSIRKRRVIQDNLRLVCMITQKVNNEVVLINLGRDVCCDQIKVTLSHRDSFLVWNSQCYGRCEQTFIVFHVE